MHVRRGCLNRRFKVCATVRGMSYSVRVTCQEGKAEVSFSGDLPDGELIVSGHADGRQRSLGVSQTDAAGRLVLVASANAYKES